MDSTPEFPSIFAPSSAGPSVPSLPFRHRNLFFREGREGSCLGRLGSGSARSGSGKKEAKKRPATEHLAPGPARPAAPLRRRGVPRPRLDGRGVPHRRRGQRVADAPQQDVLRRLGAHQAHQHRRQTE
jgi:hypothetical protein